MLAERAMTKSGHATLESLLDYVDTAFKVKSKYEQVIHNVEVAKTYETYQKRRKRLLDDFEKEKISKEIYIEREKSLTASMERVLMAA